MSENEGRLRRQIVVEILWLARARAFIAHLILECNINNRSQIQKQK